MKRIGVYRVVQQFKDGFVPFEDPFIGSHTAAAEACEAFLQHEYGGFLPDREVCGVMYLNTKNRINGLEILGVGTLNSGLMHPRECFKGAILHNAASIIFFHNHPSGDPMPSPEDISITQRLVSAGELLGIEVLDHIIVGEKAFVSLKERGLM